ncbi:hypothetical protein BCR34DRAFT_554556 [Clohesyomyces aquaticus]|uniref:PRP38-assoc multi-domain protein n=1 Tax=Clohesyomyces aquaticus TaxID=1231657 RepID=A0A1Y2A630_9PLEO|nr:hypothetical protein BCR34DRAFT_554556 [Clohesyomyces aquaticus]
MAAQEYYFGSQRVANHARAPNMYPSQPQYPYQQPPQPSQHQLQTYDTPPPSYSAYTPHPKQVQGPLPPPHQQQWPSNGRPASATPYPSTPPPLQRQQFPPPPSQQPQNGYLGAPLQPIRSRSQPPRVHFQDTKYDSDDSTVFSPSDGDRSSRRSHHHRRRRKHGTSSTSQSRHRHHYYHDRSSSSSPSDRDSSHDRSRDHDLGSGKNHSRGPRVEHKDRDTFLGASGGALLGDVIFPGLGTAAGLLLGGYGGRKHAKKRSESDVGRDGGRERQHREAFAGQGWDPESATFRKGHAIR